MSRDSKGQFIKGEKPVKHKTNCSCFRCTGIIWNKNVSWNEETKEKIRKANIGRKHPQTQGEKNVHWKGDIVGYMGLHTYIGKRKNKIGICKNCNKIGKTVWSNISYEYKRDLDDWEELCQKCHIQKDAKNGWGIALKRFPDLKRYYDKRRNNE